MSNTVSETALIKRIRRELMHWHWRLVVARCDWAKKDQNPGSLYLIDANGNIQDRQCDLINLARVLRVLGEGEEVVGCDMALANPGRTPLAAAQVAAAVAEGTGIGATSGDTNPLPWSRVRNVETGDHGLVDQEGRIWISWHQGAKGRHTW